VESPAAVRRGGQHIHSDYLVRICPDCGFAFGLNRWARHRRLCAKRTECPTCWGRFPCVSRLCPERETTRGFRASCPGPAPRWTLVKSLGMRAKRVVGADGEERWHVRYVGETRRRTPARTVNGAGAIARARGSAIERTDRRTRTSGIAGNTCGITGSPGRRSQGSPLISSSALAFY